MPEGQEVVGTRWKGGTLGEQKGKAGTSTQETAWIRISPESGCFLPRTKSRSPSLGLLTQCPSLGLGARDREGQCVLGSVVQWEFAFSGQTGDLGPCPGPAAS